MEQELIPDLKESSERIVEGHEWTTAVATPPFDLRIHRVRDVGDGGRTATIDRTAKKVDLLLDRSLIKADLAEIFERNGKEVSRNYRPKRI